MHQCPVMTVTRCYLIRATFCNHRKNEKLHCLSCANQHWVITFMSLFEELCWLLAGCKLMALSIYCTVYSQQAKRTDKQWLALFICSYTHNSSYLVNTHLKLQYGTYRIKTRQLFDIFQLPLSVVLYYLHTDPCLADLHKAARCVCKEVCDDTPAKP